MTAGSPVRACIDPGAPPYVGDPWAPSGPAPAPRPLLIRMTLHRSDGTTTTARPSASPDP